MGDDSNPDQVKCIVCQCEVDCWEECDDPFAEHKGAEPKCPLVKMKNPYKPLTLGDVLKLEKKANEFLMVSVVYLNILTLDPIADILSP